MITLQALLKAYVVLVFIFSPATLLENYKENEPPSSPDEQREVRCINRIKVSPKPHQSRAGPQRHEKPAGGTGVPARARLRRGDTHSPRVYYSFVDGVAEASSLL